MPADNKVIITAIIKDRQKSHTISFPIKDAEITAVIKPGNIDACKVTSISCEEIPILSAYIGYPGNDTKIGELRYIAEVISELTLVERDTLSAFLEMKMEAAGDSRRKGNVPERLCVLNVMEAVENLNYMLLDGTVKSYEDIGNRLLDKAMKNCQPAIDRLTSSKDESDARFMRFVSLLHDNFDITAYGRRYCEKNSLHLTSKGILTVAWDLFNRRDNRDIPANYYEYAAYTVKPSILKQVNDNKGVVAISDRPDNPGKPGKEHNSIG